MLLDRSRAKEPSEGVATEQQPVLPNWREVVLAFGVAYLFFLLLIPHFLNWLNPPTGDEPFYLMTAQSIVADRDIDELNNYLQNDFWKFSPSCEQIMTRGWGRDVYSPGFPAPGIILCPGPYAALSSPLPPHFSQGIIREGEYTKHGLGLSFLIAPAWAIGGRWLVMAFIGALAGLIGANIFLLAWEITGKNRVAWLCWLLLVFAAPIICYALLVFPATPAALLVIYSWRRLRLAAQARIQARQTGQPVPQLNGIFRSFLIGCCIGFLPWLHSVYLVLSLSLGLYWLLGGRIHFSGEKSRTRFNPLPSGYGVVSYLLFAVPILFFGALFIAYYMYYYGAPLPNTQDHAGFAPITELWNGGFGLLFDQKWGLLIYAPIYLIALAGWVLLPFGTGNKAVNARRRSDAAWLLATILPYYLIMASYKQWWGEWCPPARYLMPILPLLALPLAVALNEIGAKARAFFVPLCAFFALWGFAIAAAFMYIPKIMYHWQDDQPAKLLTWLQTNLDFLKNTKPSAWFPSYATLLAPNEGSPFILVAILWVVGALILLGLLVWAGLRKFPLLNNH